MSDSILERPKKTLEPTTTPSEETKADARSLKPATRPADEKEKSPIKEFSSKKTLFGGGLNMDLKNALDSWDIVTEQVSDKVAPDQEQLQEVKKLLGELKSQLDEFID